MSDKIGPIVFLRGPRVALRPILETDVPYLMRWMNDLDVVQYLMRTMPAMEAGEREWVQRLHAQRQNSLVLMLVVDGAPIGTMGLHHIDWCSGTATTGTAIGEKAYWENGYGTEAKMMLLHHAFHALNLRKICSSVLAFNDRSAAYSKKCGYKEEARLRLQHYRFGRYWDEILLAVFREDWEPLWEQFIKKHNLTIPQP